MPKKAVLLQKLVQKYGTYILIYRYSVVKFTPSNGMPYRLTWSRSVKFLFFFRTNFLKTYTNAFFLSILICFYASSTPNCDLEPRDLVNWTLILVATWSPICFP